MITSFQAKYFAYDLTRRHGANDVGRLSQSLFDASVDLNPHQIEAAFKTLQAEMDERIQARMTDTRKMLLENFDEEVHDRLRIQLQDTKAQLDRFSKRFWSLTHFILNDSAQFDDVALAFDLSKPPKRDIAAGRYHLIS